VRAAWPSCPPLSSSPMPITYRQMPSASLPHKVVAAMPCCACVHTLSLCCLELSPPSLSFVQARVALTRCMAIKGALRLAFCPHHRPPVRSDKQTTTSPIFFCHVHHGQRGSPSLLPVMQVAEHYLAPRVLPKLSEKHLPHRRAAAPSPHQ
jgi:hypothetical protein